MSFSQNDITRYLGVLGVEAGKPDLETLTRIVRAHLTKIPFENISKLFSMKSSGRPELADFSQYLHGIERYHFGGTCYSTNYYLSQLLNALGYDAAFCGADMSKPDVHVVSIVTVAGREYIVDVGFAAPFLDPLPRDLSTDHAITFGTDRYVLSPQDATGRSRLTLYRNGTARLGYVVNPRPRRIEEFTQVIADSYRQTSTFMNAILLTKFGVDHSMVIHNLTQIEFHGGSPRKTDLKSVDGLIAAIQTHFLIPAEVSRPVIDGLSMAQDAWG